MTYDHRAVRPCPACGKPLEKRHGETRHVFLQRRTCGPTCVRALRTRRVPVYDVNGVYMTAPEIAEMIGAPYQTVKSRLKAHLPLLRRHRRPPTGLW